jgi:glycine cleavage system aminomethyltransferase T
VIARIHWRGQPAKRLRGLLIDADQIPAKGVELWAEDGKKIGEITSSTFSLGLNRIVALGYVHRHYLNPGTAFRLKSGGTEIGRAELADLPFIKTADRV